MIRREFFKVLGGLPFLGFLKGSPEVVSNVEPEVVSNVEPVGIDSDWAKMAKQSFSSFSTNNTPVVWWFCSYDGKVVCSCQTCHMDDGLYCTANTSEGCEYMWTVAMMNSAFDRLDEEDGGY